MGVHINKEGNNMYDQLSNLLSRSLMYDQLLNTCPSSQYTCSLPPLVVNQWLQRGGESQGPLGE